MNLCDYDDEPTLRRPRGVVSCTGWPPCGALDCPRCHAENFDADMNYVGDDDDNAEALHRNEVE